MEEDESANPHHIGFLGPRTEMTGANGGTNAIQKLRRLIHPPRLPRKRDEAKFIY